MNTEVGENGQNISGTVEDVIFQSADTGYTVCEIDCGDGLPTVLVGNMPYIAEGDSLKATGRWVNHPTYGRQFKVEMYEKQLPTSKEGILRYLSSGAIAGIGPKTAKRLVDKYGEDTFEVMEDHPDWLAEIPGISRRKADDICSKYIEMSASRGVMMFCSEYFGTATSMKIYKKWGGKAVDMIKSNPYRLCDEFSGIGFKRADAIASSCGIARDSEARIDGGLTYVLTSAAMTEGHTCLPESVLADRCSALLGIAREAILPVLSDAISCGRLIQVPIGGDSFVYLARYRTAETYSADKLRQIDRQCPRIDPGDIDAFILRTEKANSLTYAGRQRDALCAALGGGVMVLTGGPGTGKTTVIKGLISIFDSLDFNVALAAPTGRAAKRMSEATGQEAKTVHRLLEMEHNDDLYPKFARNSSYYMDEDVIIIDETSMMDVLLLEALLKAIKPGARLIFIGDRDQLPSVGAGNVLADLIDCGAFRTVFLTEVFRQARESLIIVNAHAINDGKMPCLSDKSSDFFFMPREDDRAIAATVAQLVSVRLPKAYGSEFGDGVQVITPSKKGLCGTAELNNTLRSILNPPSPDKMEKTSHGILFRDGDKVMQNKNNYDARWIKDGCEGVGVFNGDIGTILSIDNSGGTVLIDFDGRQTEYELTSLEELELAYAITVHKSQGSEYGAVIIPLYSCAPMLLTRNLLYTAVTRAEKMVILVGRKSVLETMVNNNMHATRYTGLSYLMKRKEQSGASNNQ